MSSPPLKRPRTVESEEGGKPLPGLPRPRIHVSESATFSLGLKELADELEDRRSKLDAVLICARKLTKQASHSIHYFNAGDDAARSASLSEAQTTAGELLQLLSSLPASLVWLRTHGTVAGSLQKCCAGELLAAFFATGELPRKAELLSGSSTDAEFVGSSIELAEILGRYTVGRATLGDVKSVEICRDLTQQINGKLLEFDFRNGPLRKRYDGLKWSLRRIEDLLYELSVNAGQDQDGGAEEDPKSGAGGYLRLLEGSDFNGCRVRMAKYDERREQVIKRSRDVQKHAKQAIFATHRGDAYVAAGHIESAVTAAVAIQDELLAVEPLLRGGSFSNAIEELVEAQLFRRWLENGGLLTRGELRAEFGLSQVTAEEYLGGLNDFTGEVGRWAVAKATKRDHDAVEKALEADLVVQAAMLSLEDTGLKGIDKKAHALRTNVRKLEHILYELSLLKGNPARRTLDVKPAPAPANVADGAASK